MIRKMITARNTIQIGESTQTHGQEMNPVSFRVMNTMVRRPGNPMPLDVADELLIVNCISNATDVN